MNKKKILVVRKMSALEFYYDGNHQSADLRESKDEQDGNVKKILEKLQKAGFSYKVVTRRDLTESLVESYDFVFSLGGDGTVIATAAFNKDKPQLNIRIDVKSNGNLCYSPEKAIESFLAGEYKIEEWTRQDIFLDGKFIGRALNETAVGENLDFTKMARYNLKADRETDYHKDSGIIIVTGTGSTGWPGAFKPYSRKSKIFKFLTILPCEGRKRGSGNHFEIEYKGHEGKFTIDTAKHDLPRDSLLKIKLSENPLKVIKPRK